MSSPPSILLTGGGTGGHVFPLLAVARALSLAADVRCVFVGTDRGLETRLVPEAGFRLEVLPVLPFRGRGLRGASRGLLSVTRALPRCRALLRELEPRCVFSLGGYASVPMALAGRASGVPLALMEPNSVPGFGNRLMAPMAQRAYLAFDEAERFFRRSSVRRFGVAIRDGFDPARPPRSPSAGHPTRILVLGGSQGARQLNEQVPRALSQLSQPFVVQHQTGRDNAGAVEQLYKELLVGTAQVCEFISDMPKALQAADLVVSRSGASAVAEISAVGRPSVLVPLATSAGDHQKLNAQALERVGAAAVLPAGQDSVGRLRATLEQLLSDPGCLVRMGEAARAWGRPRAAASVALDLLALAAVPAALSTSTSSVESAKPDSREEAS